MKFLDLYDLRARAFPALLCLVPALVLLVSVYGVGSNIWQSGLSILLSCGFVFLLARIARDAGIRIQNNLFEEWSGAPTTQLLRHKNTHIDVHTKQKLHSRLSTLTGIPFPSLLDEQERPLDADEVYRAAAKWLIRKTRDTQQFPLVFKENIHFGFQRNALGLRWIGLMIALLTMIWIFFIAGVFNIHCPYFVLDHTQNITVPMALPLLASILMALIWFFAITKDAAKRTGFAYAERLLESADLLTPDPV